MHCRTRPTTLLCCLLSYILLLVSVFLVTYDSPVLTNIRSTRNIGSPISKMAVIIIIDGVGQRAWDSIMLNRFSFLTNITREHGISGVVQANSPTESRPRHTAIFAGFEEDIANIKTGWSRSLQPFESVFNNVGASWAFGIETVLNYFDANIKRMSHGNSLSDFQVLQAFLTSANRIMQELSVQKNDVNGSAHGKIVFLHFDSTDHAGHIFGYPSPGYSKAVFEADNFTQSVFEFFRKNLPKEFINATTFIVASDHGVSHYGHGGGGINELYVPIFMWGSGILHEQSHPLSRKLDSKSGYQILLNQLDICPLIASLLGIKTPSNSMGSLTVDLLDVSPARKLQLLLSNNRHLWRLLQATIERIKSTSFFPFLASGGEEPRVVEDLLEETDQLIQGQKRTQDRLISQLNSYRWFTWWTFSPLWISVIVMISLNLISVALMSEPSPEGFRGVCAKYLIVLILLAECLRVTSAAARELTLVALLCLLACTFLNGTARILRKTFQNYLPQSKTVMDTPLTPALCFRFTSIFLSFIFMLAGFYVKPLFCLSFLSVLAAQTTLRKLNRTLLVYLGAVSSSLVSCILLIEHFRNQEKPHIDVITFTKAFGLFTMALWVRGNFLFTRNFASCDVGYSSVLVHNVYTTLLTKVQFLLPLWTYLFGLDLFSYMARKIFSRNFPTVTTILPGVLPILLLVACHMKILAWQRKSIRSEHQSVQNRNAIAMFLLFLVSQSFCLLTLHGHGSWAEIGSNLAYTLAVPSLCLLIGLLFLTLRRT